MIGSVRLSAQKTRNLNIQVLPSVLSCDEQKKAKMLLLCSQALHIARKLYKSLAIVDHAYRPNLLLQSLLCMLKLSKNLKTSVNKAHRVCALRALAVRR